jgi:hypothetical protein
MSNYVIYVWESLMYDDWHYRERDISDYMYN